MQAEKKIGDVISILKDYVEAAEGEALEKTNILNSLMRRHFTAEESGLKDKIIMLYYLKKTIEAVEENQKIFKSIYDEAYKQYVPESMESEGIDKISISGIGTAYLQSDMYVQMVPEKKSEAMEWLDDTGNGDIIKPTVNANTLASLIKSLLRENVPVPAELFKVTPYSKTVIKRS